MGDCKKFYISDTSGITLEVIGDGVAEWKEVQ